LRARPSTAVASHVEYDRPGEQPGRGGDRTGGNSSAACPPCHLAEQWRHAGQRHREGLAASGPQAQPKLTGPPPLLPLSTRLGGECQSKGETPDDQADEARDQSRKHRHLQPHYAVGLSVQHKPRRGHHQRDE
jgi:hypothetical protein